MRIKIIALLLSLTLFSCYKDENDYDYTVGKYIDLDEIISNVSFPRGTAGELYVYEVAEITDSLLDLYDFRWEENALSGDSLQTYSTGATLSFTPESSSTYYFRLIAVSKDGGFYSTSEKFGVTVTSISTSGMWLIAGEYDGVNGLSVAFPNGTEEPEVSHNVATGLPDNVKDFKIGCSTSYYYNAGGDYTSFSEYSIIVEGEDECVFLENDYPFDVVTTLTDNVLDPEDGFKFHTYFQANGQSFMISKSGKYYKKVKAVGAQYNYDTPYYYSPFKYEYDGVEEEVKIIDYMCEYSDLVNNNGRYNIGIIIERESTGKRELKFISDETSDFTIEEYTASIEYATGSDVETTGLDLDDLGDWNLEYSYYNNVWYIYNIFKKDDDVKVVWQVRSVSDSKNYSEVEVKTFPRPDIIDETTVYKWQKINSTFGSISDLSSNPSTSYIFIAHENIVYKYVFSTNTVTEYYTSIPAGETIKGLTMNAQQSELLIGTDKGTLHLVNIERTELVLTDAEKLTYTIDGFTRIDALGYKWKSYYAAIFSAYGCSSGYYD